MKKFLCFMLIFTMLFINCNTIISNAEGETVAKVGEQEYATLKAAIDAAGTKTVVITKDIVLTSQIKIIKTRTIDLNGHTISGNVGENKSLFYIANGKLTLKGTGTVKETNPTFSPITVMGAQMAFTKTYGTLVVEEGVTLSGCNGIHIQNHPSAKALYGANVTLKGKIEAEEAGIYINGNAKNESKNTLIKILDTAEVKGKTGIYAAGYAQWEIDGAKIQGVNSGIAMKAGDLTIKSGTIRATGQDTTPTENSSNGINPSGCALQIESNPGYGGNIKINIEDGTFISDNAPTIYEYDSTGQSSKVNSIKILGGKFIAGSGKKNIEARPEFAEKLTGNIYGGTYDEDITRYLKSGLAVFLNSNREYEVGAKATDIKLNTTDLKLELGETGKILASVEPFDAVEEVSFSSSDTNVVTVDSTGKVVAVKPGTATVTVSAGSVEKTCKVTVNTKPIKMDLPAIEVADKTDISVGISDKQKDKVQAILQEEAKKNEVTKNALENGKDATVEVAIEKRKEGEVEKADKNMISEVIGQSEKLVQYLDINILVKSEGKDIARLTELSNKITISIIVPDDLLVEGRQFHILRIHDGKVDRLPTNLEGNILEFETDKFSTYALTYTDEVKTNSKKDDKSTTNQEGITKTEEQLMPKTGDEKIEIWVTTAMIAMVGIAITFIKNKKGKHMR